MRSGIVNPLNDITEVNLYNLSGYSLKTIITRMCFDVNNCDITVL